jgi:chitodextrinase
VTTQESTPADADPSPGTAVQVADITVPDSAADASATIRMTVSADRLSAVDATAEQLQVTRFADGEWQSLDTSVVDESGDGVVLEARTPGFSYFAVNAVSEPEATAAVEPTTVPAGESVTLDGSESTTEHGDIVSYEWSVADQTLTGETASATLDETGEHVVELTVTNDAGETDTATATLTVDSTATGDGADGGDGTADGADDTDEEPAGLGLAAIGGLVALVVVVAAAVAVRRRGSDDTDPLR